MGLMLGSVLESPSRQALVGRGDGLNVWLGGGKPVEAGVGWKRRRAQCWARCWKARRGRRWLESSECTHFRSSVLGECQIFRGCTQTYWRAHDANTYQKCAGTSSTSHPTFQPTPASTGFPSPSPTLSPSPLPTSVPTDSPLLDCGGYDLIYANGLSCDNVHMIEMKCNHGGGSCSENTCQRYCDESFECTHFRSSVLE